MPLYPPHDDHLFEGIREIAEKVNPQFSVGKSATILLKKRFTVESSMISSLGAMSSADRAH